MRWTEKDLIGPDGKTRGWPNNVSRAANADMERRIAERFGPDEVERTRKALGVRSDWNNPQPRGSTSMYGPGYSDPVEQSRSEFERDMDEKDPDWREGAFPDEAGEV